nr:transglycosylase family protein [Brevibacterium daeguense]
MAAAGLLSTGAPAQAETVWDRVAECESGGDWSINTGNGYYGGLQFSPSTWEAFGGEGMPHEASKAEQIRVAQNTLEGQGPGAWPVCSGEAGLTKDNGAAEGAGAETGSEDGAAIGGSDGTESGDSADSGASGISAADPASTITVEAGDTLYRIAVDNGIEWEDLYEANKDELANPETISVGQELKLPN